MIITKINNANAIQSQYGFNLQGDYSPSIVSPNLKPLKQDTVTFGSGYIRVPEKSARKLREIAEYFLKHPNLVGTATCSGYDYKIAEREMEIIFNARRQCEVLKLKLREDGGKVSGLDITFIPHVFRDDCKTGFIRLGSDFSILEMEDKIPYYRSSRFHKSMEAIKDVILP